VEFGDLAATSFTVMSDNEISVTVPASDGNCAVSASQGICPVAVTVTTPDGTSSGPAILPAYSGPIIFGPGGAFVAPVGCACEICPAPEEYDYSAAPHITSVSPQYASENGTTTEVITGTGFNLLTFDWVNVGPAGSNFSQDFDIEGISATQIAIGIPPASQSTEPVSSPISVSSGLQLSNVSSFSYAGTPVLTALSTHVGDQADPGDLTITGQGLSDVTSVVFQIQLTSTSTTFTSQADTSLTVVVPQGYAAPADVLLCSATGCSAPDPSVDTYTLAYKGRPVLTSSSPASGPAHGGTPVVIDGELDSEITGVFFGKTPAVIVSNPLFTPSAPFKVLAPAGKAGTTVDITITTLGGTLTSPPEPRSAVNPHVT
jgi:IPT/TIG domain